jgi:hypothetical protein
MKNSVRIAACFAALAFCNTAFAGDYQSQVDHCLNQFANTHDQASVMLECDAQSGKLTNCKVVENNGSQGFAKAAMCVAEFLPMGSKTGAVKVPVRFAGDA